MSDYTTRQILDMIEDNGGPAGLDLSEKDLSGIDLSYDTIQAEFAKLRQEEPEAEPKWVSADTGSVNLVRAILKGTNLYGAQLQRADLQYAKLQKARSWEIGLQNARLRGAGLQKANLTRARLQEADLDGARLQRAILHKLQLQGTILRAANLERAMPVEANFEGANLQFSNLAWVNLLRAESIKGASLYRATLDHTQLTKDQLGGAVGEELGGQWYRAKETYLALKNNFKQIGRYDDAAWAYRRMEKLDALQKARSALQEPDWRRATQNYAKVARDQLVQLVCDYGESIWRVLGTMLNVWILFALVYGLIAGVWGPWQETATGQIRYITRNPIDLLTFSLGAMTTLVPTALEAHPMLGMRILMPLEAMLGIGLAGLLGFVAGNRIRRS